MRNAFFRIGPLKFPKPWTKAQVGFLRNVLEHAWTRSSSAEVGKLDVLCPSR
jgi:hypothetical protein